MKNIERDFTLIAQVPDDAKLEDCEVIIHKASASFIADGKPVTVEYAEGPDGKDDVEIVVLSTRFVNPDGGDILEED